MGVWDVRAESVAISRCSVVTRSDKGSICSGLFSPVSDSDMQRTTSSMSFANLLTSFASQNEQNEAQAVSTVDDAAQQQKQQRHKRTVSFKHPLISSPTGHIPT